MLPTFLFRASLLGQTIYFNHRHISPVNNGLVRSVGLSAKLLAGPTWGYLSDKTGRPGMLLLLSAVTCALSLECLRHDIVYQNMKYLMLVKAVRSAGNGVGTLVRPFMIHAG